MPIHACVYSQTAPVSSSTRPGLPSKCGDWLWSMCFRRFSVAASQRLLPLLARSLHCPVCANFHLSMIYTRDCKLPLLGISGHHSMCALHVCIVRLPPCPVGLPSKGRLLANVGQTIEAASRQSRFLCVACLPAHVCTVRQRLCPELVARFV